MPGMSVSEQFQQSVTVTVDVAARKVEKSHHGPQQVVVDRPHS